MLERRDFSVKRRPKQARARATFDAIIEAATRILDAEGYAALTTEHLAQLAGVGVGSVYEYFPDKDTVVAEVVRRLLDELTADLSAGAVAAISKGPAALLTEWVRVMFATVGKRRGLLRTLFEDVPFLDEIDEVREFPMRMYSLATASPPELKTLPYVTTPVIFLITTMVRSAVLESVLHPPPGVTQEQLEATLVQILLALLASSFAAKS